jgi:hypothetical protein
MKDLNAFQTAPTKRCDARVAVLCQHLRSDRDLLGFF